MTEGMKLVVAGVVLWLFVAACLGSEHGLNHQGIPGAAYLIPLLPLAPLLAVFVSADTPQRPAGVDEVTPETSPTGGINNSAGWAGLSRNGRTGRRCPPRPSPVNLSREEKKEQGKKEEEEEEKEEEEEGMVGRKLGHSRTHAQYPAATQEDLL
ncbi:hypothetical protein O3P69_013098 [Scylla paramamosain]|uniref:Uncharacterized protein n=1 Tax=Scylla paramamosain TaxID=85552 RepID=A0AAW0SHY7_SCYPA